MMSQISAYKSGETKLISLVLAQPKFIWLLHYENKSILYTPQPFLIIFLPELKPLQSNMLSDLTLHL